MKASPGSGLGEYDVAFFTASCDDAETNKRYAEGLKLDYPILSDPDKEAAVAYGVVNEDRTVPFRWTYIIGKDGRILQIDKQVDAANHGAEVIAHLKELGVPKK